jgi:hypothetical protein
VISPGASAYSIGAGCGHHFDDAVIDSTNNKMSNGERVFASFANSPMML